MWLGSLKTHQIHQENWSSLVFQSTGSRISSRQFIGESKHTFGVSKVGTQERFVGTDAFHIIQSLGVNNRAGFGGPKNKGRQIENDEPQKQLTCPIPYWLVNRDYNKRLQESTTPGFLRGLYFANLQVP